MNAPDVTNTQMNPDDADRFLAAWFAQLPDGELCEVRPLNKRPGKKPLRQEWFSSAVEAAAYVRRCVEHGDDVYLGALPRRERAGGAQSVGSLVWLWGDVDYGAVGHNTPAQFASREAALAAITSLEVQPTMLVETGGGFQAWYALARPAEPHEWRAVSTRLFYALNADASATDVPRILRIPGTFNLKVDPPRVVRLLEASGRAYELEEFDVLPDAPEDVSDDVEQLPLPPARPATGHHGHTGERPFDRANDVPISDVLKWLGVTSLHREGSRVYCACPVHSGKNRSQMVVGGARNVATCFGDCNRTFTPVDLAINVLGLAKMDAVNRMAEQFGFDGFTAKVIPMTPKGRAGAPAGASTATTGVTSPAVGGVGASSSDPNAWRTLLAYTSNNAVRNTYGNVAKIVRHHQPYAGKLSYDAMRLMPLFDGRVMTDSDVGRMREEVEQDFAFSPSVENLRMAISTIAEERSSHPVQEYLQGLTWDGVERIAHVATDVLGIERPDAITQKVLRAWFVSAVARALRPGCKVDTSLVLVGPQGFKKSTFFAVLGGAWFADTHMDITNKDGLLQLHAAWIYEWAEVENVTGRRHASEVKQFLTSASDTFRLPFGRTVGTHPRSTVIVGTTNETQFLNDVTGSRRFWVVPVEQAIDTEVLTQWRDQLWAEAIAAYRANEQWWLDRDDEAKREEVAAAFQTDDPWEAPILETLSTWPPMVPLTTHELMIRALKLEPVHQSPGAIQRVARVMRTLGYDNPRAGGRAGRVRVWSEARGQRDSGKGG